MKAKTLKALKGSIAKWKAIVARTGVDRGDRNCPLCREFQDCEGCPIMKKTGEADCFGTPYYAWRAAADLNLMPVYPIWENTNEASQREAERMLEFLKALLPKKAKRKGAGKAR